MHFTGRQTELAHLHAARERVFQGGLRNQLQTGRRGIGKTSLVLKHCGNQRALYLYAANVTEGLLTRRFTGFGRRHPLLCESADTCRRKKDRCLKRVRSLHFLGRSSALGRRCGPVKSCLFINARHQIHRLHGLTGSALHKVVFHDKNHQKVPTLRTVHGNASKV